MHRALLATAALTLALALAGVAEARPEAAGVRGRATIARQLHQELVQHHGAMGHHTVKVSAHARRIAKALGLSWSMGHAAAAAAFLHDIGKTGVSIHTLDGIRGEIPLPDKKALADHPQVGLDRLLQLFPKGRLRRTIAGGIIAHHERPDGKGYPHQLGGEHIPLMGRIVAVADAYDAMTTARGYNDPLTHEQAIAELRKSAGVRLDRRVVDAFIASYAPAD